MHLNKMTVRFPPNWSVLEEVRQRLWPDNLLTQCREAVLDDTPIASVLDARLTGLLAAFHANTIGLHISAL